ncbi:MAG: hypothetical protein JHC33_12030 [Ignisphaera sp.]|nr:hypothetical protein [Ignisphaera sp.]
MKPTSLSFTQIRELADKQQAYEASYSIAGLRLAIKESVSKLDAETLDINWIEYLSKFNDSSVEHKDYHYSLLSQHAINWSKVFSILIENLVTNHSYLEHRVVGYKLGQELCNKVIVLSTGRVRASHSTKLTLGANIIQFLKVTGFIKNKVISSTDHHTHNIIEPSSKLQAFLQDEGLYIKASRVRSGGAAYRLVAHTTENQGGNYLSPKTMLNGTTSQSELALAALNHQQSVPYKLISNNELVTLLDEYKQADRWFDKDGVFLSKEWNKMIEDLHRFQDEVFYIPYAFENSSGRMHSCSPYLNPQGDSFQKRMLTINGNSIKKYDCRNNNLQVYSLLGSDKLTGSRVGLTSNELGDLRIELANRLNDYVGANVFVKDTVKHLVMIAFYGGMEKQLLDNLDTIKDDNRYAGKYTIRDLVPEHLKAGLYDFIIKALEELAPAALKLMNLIYRFNNENQSHYQWTMPDGFVVSYDVMETVTHKGYYADLQMGKTHSVSIEAKVPNNTKYNRSLAPNIVRSVESYIAREVCRRADFAISMIHDSYGIEAGNEEKLFSLVKTVMADVNDMDLLHNLLSQIDPTLGFRITKGSLSREDIMAAMPLSYED